MDELDKLYVELVEIIRRDRPDSLESPITVAEVHRDLVPYQRVRSQGGFRSYDDYESALSRLFAGERGYLGSDAPDMQAEITAGLEEAYPDARRFHAFADAHVWLNAEHIPPPGHIRYAPPELQEEAKRAADEERRIREAERKQEEEEARIREEEERLERERLEAEAEAVRARREAAASLERPRAAFECGECGSALPGRSLKFCPFCGVGLSVQCESCGADMASGWAFCGECGSAAEEAADDASA